MSLSQLIYVSHLHRPLTPAELGELVAHSETKNRKADLSGVLLVHGRSVMQLLEGDAGRLDPLFDRIAADPRHHRVERLLFKPVGKRLYPEWGMGLTSLRSPLELDRTRMRQMLDDIRSTTNTGSFSVEARVLLRDFESQARLAA